jgi:formylglycine-generating enzyme required for sulfatase activity
MFVKIPGADVLFCIHETRRQDYAAFALENPKIDNSWRNQQFHGAPCGDQASHPVVGVSWEDARQFCAWLSKKEGRTCRLPTDQEWSLAVGLGRLEQLTKATTPEKLSGKDTVAFPWEGTFPPHTQSRGGNFGDTALREISPASIPIEGYTDGFPTTAPVMTFKPNRLGIYDLGGNAWEWVEDWWNVQEKDKVARGASFYSTARSALLSSFRSHFAPSYRDATIGFRCVIVAP